MDLSNAQTQDRIVLDTLTSLQVQNLAVPYTFGARAGWRLTPHTAAQVADALHWAQRQGHAIALRSDEAALLADTPLWLDLSDLHRVRQHPTADFIIEVETGMTMGALDRILSTTGQAFPLSYPPETLLADILAEDRPALETGFRGYPRDYVLKTELATPDAQLTISGADVVKNVTGYDLAKLYVGGQHAFGVLTSVTLKLASRPAETRYWLYKLGTPAALPRLWQQLQTARLPLSVCEAYRKEGQWHVLISIAGDGLLLDECQAMLTAMQGQPNLPDAQTIDAGTAQIIMQRLRQWGTEEGPATGQLVTEIAVPLGHWPAMLSSLLHWTPFAKMHVQIRPAAGLLYCAIPALSSADLFALADKARTLDGFVQVVQAPAAAAGPLGATNLPTAEAARGLLKALKKGYDPEGVLFHPRLPL